MIARFSAQEDVVLCIANHEWIPSVVLSGGADCCARVHDVRMRPGKSTVMSLHGFESDVEVREKSGEVKEIDGGREGTFDS